MNNRLEVLMGLLFAPLDSHDTKKPSHEEKDIILSALKKGIEKGNIKNLEFNLYQGNVTLLVLCVEKSKSIEGDIKLFTNSIFEESAENGFTILQLIPDYAENMVNNMREHARFNLATLECTDGSSDSIKNIV